MDDEFFAHEGDLDAAQELVMTVGPEVGELFTYPGNGHLFVDSSLPSYDAEATALVVERSRTLLDRLGWTPVAAAAARPHPMERLLTWPHGTSPPR